MLHQIALNKVALMALAFMALALLALNNLAPDPAPSLSPHFQLGAIVPSVLLLL
jgi:hypothetical protein